MGPMGLGEGQIYVNVPSLLNANNKKKNADAIEFLRERKT